MVRVAKTLVMADRIGSWQMHLRAVSDCIAIFAAAGHYNYLKSTHFHVQEMCHLDIKHPDVFRKCEKGFYVIRRSSHTWTGLSSDLVMEQTLMKSLKGTGGLTHGGGMSEQQTAVWTMSSPISAEYNSIYIYKNLCTVIQLTAAGLKPHNMTFLLIIQVPRLHIRAAIAGNRNRWFLF